MSSIEPMTPSTAERTLESNVLHQTSSAGPSPVTGRPEYTARASSSNYVHALAQAALNSTPTTPGTDLPIHHSKDGSQHKQAPTTFLDTSSADSSRVPSGDPTADFEQFGPGLGLGERAEAGVQRGEGFIEKAKPILDRHQSWSQQDQRREAQKSLFAGLQGQDALGYESAGEVEGRK